MQRVERHIILKSNNNWRQIDILSFAANCKSGFMRRIIEISRGI